MCKVGRPRSIESMSEPSGKIGRKAPPPNRCWADSKSVSSNAAESDAALILRFGEPSSRAEVEVL